MKQWEVKKKEITPKAIKDCSDKIRKWIADNSKYRVPVKEKLELFNRNQNAALLSKKAQQFAEELKLALYK